MPLMMSHFKLYINLQAGQVISLKNVFAGSPNFFHANIIIVHLLCKYRNKWSWAISGKAYSPDGHRENIQSATEEQKNRNKYY